MPDGRRPSPGRFVVHSAEAREISKRLAEFGTVRVLGDLTVLEIALGETDPESAWRDLAQRVGPGLAVDPVLIDEKGSEHFPTGALMVRFFEAPGTQDLKNFALSFELKIVERNQRVPAQVCFERDETDQRYLPDLVAVIEEAADVRAAWAVTQANYQRIGRGRSRR